jgi:hypothetical protein
MLRLCDSKLMTWGGVIVFVNPLTYFIMFIISVYSLFILDGMNFLSNSSQASLCFVFKKKDLARQQVVTIYQIGTSQSVFTLCNLKTLYEMIGPK